MSSPALQPGPGYVLPSSANGELNDVFLNRFLNTLVAGLTGMANTLVFPRWQKNPPNQPSADTDWCAIGRMNRERDAFSAVLHTTVGGNGIDTEYRNQIIEVLCSFYGPNCEANSELFVQGLGIEQNLAAMLLNGFGLVGGPDATVSAPALLKEEWINGMDTRFRMRRQQIYTYPSPNLNEVVGTIANDSGSAVITVPLDVDQD